MPVQEFFDELFVDSARLLRSALKFGIGFLVVYVVGRVVVRPAVERVLALRKIEPTLERALQKVVGLAVVLLAVVVGLAFAGFTRFLSASATIVAAVTLAVGIAAQDLIGNLVSGVFIVGDNRFNIGDWIEWDDRAGTIDDIGFRTTQIRTADNGIVTVPNSELTSTAVTNTVLADRRRLTYSVEIGYGDDIEAASEILHDCADERSAVLADPAPEIRLTNLGDSGIELTAIFWISDPDETDILELRSEYGRDVKERFDAAGVELSPPSQHDLSGRVQVDDASSEYGR
ncbi:mechanosensitive ion channel family protein [Halomicrococcus sp. SG-WS-1]|uniref:mechanosensitive ion channel family protein n=1 Tax=Halomicrococcus sp. SG-WS-1 TaxID=3439057 RepID=UPI003F7AAC4F